MLAKIKVTQWRRLAGIALSHLNNVPWVKLKTENFAAVIKYLNIRFAFYLNLEIHALLIFISSFYFLMHTFYRS